MKPLEAKVREIVGGISTEHCPDCEHSHLPNKGDISEATTSILALIDGEVMAERERCAKIAQGSIQEGHIQVRPEPFLKEGYGVALANIVSTRNEIATAIRSSGEGK